MIKFEHRRALQIIKRSIARMKLNLAGYSVLTEVGSNNYLYTPTIAAMGGASKVYACSADNSRFRFIDVANECKEILKYAGLDDKVDIITHQEIYSVLPFVDVITNSGFLRPLDKSKLSIIKSSAVVPLMYEAWEVRNSDIDIDYCKRNNIKVSGTSECHPLVNVFDAVGTLAIKLSLEAGFELYNNNIAVWSKDNFGIKAREGFINAGAASANIFNDTKELMHHLPNIDLMFICDYNETNCYFGDNGLFNLNEIVALNPCLGIVHLYGNIDNELLKQHGIKVYPDKLGKACHMSESLAYIGATPVIDLQVAGFKVAEEMLKDELSSLSQPLTF
jgi:hypothetical protein